MNNIKAIVKNIDSVDGLNIVYFDFNDITLSMMSLELPKEVKIGVKVFLGIKPSHIIIAKDFCGILSASNSFETTITNITKGELLATINMQYKDTIFETLTTVNSINKMELKIEDKVTTIIKASELFIKKVLI